LLSLRPWDLQVDISGGEPLRPYKTTDELINKSIQSLSKVDDYFGGCIQLMKDMQRLDLDSRIGKHPGGYNMPLPFSGVPFIFMNAANSLRDVTTIMHEAGHAVHSVLTKDFPLSINRSMPSEVAELASMTMELFTMDYWNTFFTNEQELQKAKIKQLEGVLDVLPWIATIDKFQHWIYTNPKHTQKQRAKVWMEIFNQFSGKVVDRTGLEKYTKNLWQKQLHIFEVPFYYIEYGMAQLGAIALWQQYRKEPKSAVTNYTNALKLGYTKTIGDTYAAANIQFDFSSKYVKSLASFVQAELNNIL
ncbi:MAG: M3 family metallopeptidase, partial [Saprospiraceae bacterium]